MALVVDTFSEVHKFLKPWRTSEFYDLSRHEIVPGATYVIGRAQFHANRDRIRSLIESETIRVVFSNPHEGSDTIRKQLQTLEMMPFVLDGRLKIITGGALPVEWKHLVYDSFLVKVTEYQENHRAARLYAEHAKGDRPYSMLFLNGRARPHRKYLIERLAVDRYLDRCLWTCLDSREAPSVRLRFEHQGEDRMMLPSEIRYLPERYEMPNYRKFIGKHDPSQGTFIKHSLFNNQWGDIYINADAYTDTYFSLVTETVFDYPYSFRTEKIAKPLMVGHPWVTVSNHGWYRDLRQLGFETFHDHWDESFDLIENDQQRMEAVYDTVSQILDEDLALLMGETQDICLHNQARLLELSDQIRKEMPDRLMTFLEQ